MRNLSVLGVLGVLALGHQPAVAQQVIDVQGVGITTVADHVLVGGGIGFGVRPGAGRLRMGLNGIAGAEAGTVAGRVEGMLTFHLNPYQRRGVTAYGGGGAVARLRETGVSGFILVVIGLETRPATARSWFFEVGVGGGVRFAAGIRLRATVGAR